MQKYQACFAMRENVIKLFEYEFYFPKDTKKVEDHKVLLVNYKVIVPKEPFPDSKIQEEEGCTPTFKIKSKFKKSSNNIIGSYLEIYK